MWFLFGEVSSSSGCLGWATLFYCGIPEPSILHYLGKVVCDFCCTKEVVCHYPITQTYLCIMQRFLGCKNENFQLKRFDYCHIFAQNIDCWYPLETAVLTVTHSLCFIAKIRK